MVKNRDVRLTCSYMASVKIRHIETNKCLTLDIVRRLENKCVFSETNFDKIGQRIYKLRREKHCKNQIVLLRNGRSTHYVRSIVYQ